MRAFIPIFFLSLLSALTNAKMRPIEEVQPEDLVDLSRRFGHGSLGFIGNNPSKLQLCDAVIRYQRQRLSTLRRASDALQAQGGRCDEEEALKAMDYDPEIAVIRALGMPTLWRMAKPGSIDAEFYAAMLENHRFLRAECYRFDTMKEYLSSRER